jgi:hypothetical protein
MGTRSELWALARRQHALFTTAQALACISERQLRTLRARGDVIAVRRGVLAIAGSLPSYEQAVMAAVLAAGSGAWASHRTAARLHGLRVPMPEAIDLLTLARRRLGLDGVRHHRNEVVALRDVGLAGLVPATTVAKTLVDCSPWLRGRRFEQTVDDARRRGLVTIEEVEQSLAEVDHGRRTGRHLVVPVRPVAAARHHPGGSDRELDVLRHLRSAGLPLPVQQHRITVAGRVRYLDYAYPGPRIYLEWDGFEDHGLRRAVFDDDRERDAELAVAGWLGLHFTSRTRPTDLVRRVERALVLRAPESLEIWQPNRR